MYNFMSGLMQSYSMRIKQLFNAHEVETSVSELTSKVLLGLLTAELGKLLLQLKDPEDNGVSVPVDDDKAQSGAGSIWSPLMRLVTSRRRPGLRGRRSWVALSDRALGAAIYAMIAAPWLSLLDIRLHTVLALGGLGSLAVGLAVKNFAQNMMSGLMILFNRTICEGLDVELVGEKTAGIVHKIGWLNTQLNRHDGVQVLVPNSRVLDGAVVDKTNKRYRLVDERLVVAPQGPARLQNVVQAIEEILLNDPNILQGDALGHTKAMAQGKVSVGRPQCVVEGYTEVGSAELRIRAYYPAELPGDAFLQCKSKLLIAISERIADLGARLGC